MGLQFRDIVIKEEITLTSLKGKILAVDSMNMLYQFLTTIRSPDGSVLTDKNGRVTSHLIGLFHRVTSLMEEGLKLVFVFDGQPPAIKLKTSQLRKASKEDAASKLKVAQEEGDYEQMKKYASRTASLTTEMVDDAKQVINALGLPIVQAPSEGEAQTAYMVKQGAAYASISQDYDNLIFDCPRLIRNVSIEGRRKLPGKFSYQKINPEMIELKAVLDKLVFTLDQLRVLAILIGTDYNPGGIKGIGPKTAIKLIKQHGQDFTTLFKEINWENYFPDLPWPEILATIKDIPVTDDYSLEFKPFDRAKLIELLVKGYNFSEERIITKLDKLEKKKENFSQTGLKKFF